MTARFPVWLVAILFALSCVPGASAPNAVPAPIAARAQTALASPRLPDVAWAGYHLGTRALPRVPVVANARSLGAKGDGVSDDTKALAAAIEATHDGALLLPAGRYVLRDALRITRSRVVLRGEGAERTILVMPASLTDIHPEGDPLHGKLYGFVDARGTDEGAAIAEVVDEARRGDRRLRVRWSSSARSTRGEVVRVRMGNDDGLLRALLGGAFEPGPQTPKDYDHYVDWAALVASGDTVVLARPLPVDVSPAWHAELLSSHPTLEEIGVEDLAFEFPGTTRRPHSATGRSAQTWSDEGFRAIYLRGVANGWIRGVTVRDADDAIQLEESRFCQVENVRLGAVHREAPSGHHGLWAKGTQDCVFADFRVETQYDDNLTVEAFANGNVFTRGTGVAMNLDHHRNAPHDNVFTDLDLGDGARLWKSGGDVARGPHAGVRETLWNVRFRGSAPPLPGALHFDRPDAGWPMLNLVRVSTYPPADAAQGVWMDPAPNAPVNLWDAQRARRSPPPDGVPTSSQP